MSSVLLEGSDEYDAALQKLVELIVDLRLFWPMTVPLFVGWIGRQFDTEGEYFGDAWAPLSDAYLAWKTRHYPDKGILSAEGDLRRAATHPKRTVTSESIVLRIVPYEKTERSTDLTPSGKTSRKRVGIGKTIDPDWFQSGTDKMPARPLLADDLPQEAKDELRSAAESYVNENARKLGLLASL